MACRATYACYSEASVGLFGKSIPDEVWAPSAESLCAVLGPTIVEVRTAFLAFAKWESAVFESGSVPYFDDEAVANWASVVLAAADVVSGAQGTLKDLQSPSSTEAKEAHRALATAVKRMVVALKEATLYLRATSKAQKHDVRQLGGMALRSWRGVLTGTGVLTIENADEGWTALIQAAEYLAARRRLVGGT